MRCGARYRLENKNSAFFGQTERISFSYPLQLEMETETETENEKIGEFVSQGSLESDFCNRRINPDETIS